MCMRAGVNTSKVEVGHCRRGHAVHNACASSDLPACHLLGQRSCGCAGVARLILPLTKQALQYLASQRADTISRRTSHLARLCMGQSETQPSSTLMQVPLLDQADS